MIFKGLIFLVIVHLFSTKEVLSQSLLGKYSFSERYYYESIELFPNGTFQYYFSSEFIKTNCKGNWQLREWNLILDSSPQIDRIICHESRKCKKAFTYFNVKSKSGRLSMSYHLYIIKNYGDTIELRNQDESSKIRIKNIKGFYIINTSGIKSPTYIVQKRRTNWFDVLFENRRVFENENWRISENGILPRYTSGDYTNFLLKKKSNFESVKPKSYDMYSNQLLRVYPPFKDYNLNNYLRKYSVNPSIFSKHE